MSEAGITEITNEDWRTSTLPTTICGGSGAGKTTVARCLHDRYPGPSVLFDLDHEPGMGKVVESVAELKAALRQGVQRIAVRPPVTVIEEPDLFPKVVRFLLVFGKQLRAAGQGQVQFLMDEAQNLQEKWVLVALARMRKLRIKPVAMSQDPVSLPPRCRTVSAFNCWLSPPPARMRDTIESVGYPVDLLDDLPAYDMLVFDRDWSALDRFRAGEDYARA